MERKLSEFREYDKSVQEEMGQFKDPASLMCLARPVVASCVAIWVRMTLSAK